MEPSVLIYESRPVMAGKQLAETAYGELWDDGDKRLLLFFEDGFWKVWRIGTKGFGLMPSRVLNSIEVALKARMRPGLANAEYVCESGTFAAFLAHRDYIDRERVYHVYQIENGRIAWNAKYQIVRAHDNNNVPCQCDCANFKRNFDRDEDFKDYACVHIEAIGDVDQERHDRRRKP